MTAIARRFGMSMLLLVTVVVAGCAQEKVVDEPVVRTGPDYSRPLPPGEKALRLVRDPSRMPDLGAAFRNSDVFLLESIDQSIRWFNAPSSRQFFPFVLTKEGHEVTHEQAQASVKAFGQLIESAANETDFLERVKRKFNVFESYGYNGEGIVLYTGYYSPIFQASRERTSRFSAPLYRRPADLVTHPVTGEPQGRKLDDGRIVPYPTRREIEQSRMFEGNELVWVEDDLTAFIIHVNGSAKLRMTDGSVMYIGYGGKTDRPYYGLGRAILDEGILRPDELSLPAIRRFYRQNPDKVRELMFRNESYVFFTEYDGGNWPAGSLGVPVTRESSLATDKRIYPRGGVVMVDTHAVTFSQGQRKFQRFMLDQDTGGAIQAPGRADLFMGIGPDAEILAGGQYAEGRLYYLFLKPEFVDEFLPAPRARR
jgi:membrane-bound lytic murein transglycosylase A